MRDPRASFKSLFETCFAENLYKDQQYLTR